jgi:DnaJ-class molecular chaperone
VETDECFFSVFSNNLDDVRDHWERVKLSYEILSEPRTRRRYDRHEMLSDPGAAMQRSALNVVGKGITGVGKGIFSMAAFAAKSVAGYDKNEES